MRDADAQAVFIAEQDGQPIGFVCVKQEHDHPGAVLLDNLHVLPPWQGTGAGKLMVARAEAHRRVVEAVMALAEPYRSTVLARYFEALSNSSLNDLNIPVARPICLPTDWVADSTLTPSGLTSSRAALALPATFPAL